MTSNILIAVLLRFFFSWREPDNKHVLKIPPAQIPFKLSGAYPASMSCASCLSKANNWNCTTLMTTGTFSKMMHSSQRR